MRPALSDDHAPDRRPARQAGLAGAGVDAEEVLVAPRPALGRAVEGVEARALARDRLAQYGPDRGVQSGRGSAVATVRARERVQAGAVQRLVDVDVPEPRDEGLVQEQRLQEPPSREQR